MLAFVRDSWRMLVAGAVVGDPGVAFHAIRHYCDHHSLETSLLNSRICTVLL